MRVRFWGVRGSIPTPPTSEQISEKLVRAILQAQQQGIATDESSVRAFVASLDLPQRGVVGGNTTCVEISNDEDTLIIDAGSGIRNLGMALMQREFGRGQGTAHVFFTHAHWDHLIGWPFFVPAFIPGNTFHIYAVGASPRTYLDYQQNAPRYFPVDVDYMRAEKRFIRMDPGQEVRVGKFRISNITLPHPGISYGYRIEDEHSSFVFIGDAEFNPMAPEQMQPYTDFLRDADALAFDSAYSLRDVFFSKVDWGHSSAMIGVDMATRAGVKRLITFHHDIYASDSQVWEIAQAAQEYAVLQASGAANPVEVIPGYEGLTLELGEEVAVKWIDGAVGGTGVVQVSDDADTVSGRKVEERLIEALSNASGDRLVLDLRGLTGLDVAGLRTLLAAQGTLLNSEIAVVTADERVRGTLELVFGSNAFTYYEQFDDALRAGDPQQRHLKLSGEILSNRYRLKALQANNAIMALYSATDEQVEQPVVVQVLNANRPQFDRNEYLRVARQWRRIHHSNLLAVLDVVSAAGAQAVVFEPPMGEPLREWLSQFSPGERLPLETALSIAVGVLEGLIALHQHRLIHGYLRPETIFVDDNQRVQVSPDWVVSSQLGPSAYMAPELINGGMPNEGSDLYALGLVLYELVMGHHPFTADTDALMAAHQLQSIPKSPRALRPNISRSLEHLMLKLLAKEPSERYDSADDVRRALDSFVIASSSTQQAVSLVQTGVAIVGREREMAVLDEYLRRALAGQGQVVFLSGDVGLGKTTLVNWLMARARARGVRVLVGRCLNMEQTAPYQPIAEALTDYMTNVSAELRGQVVSQVSGIATLEKLIPGMKTLLRRGTGPLTPPAPADDSEQQYQLNQVITQLLLAAAEHEPILLFIDDLHWADQSSLALVRYLAQMAAPAGLPLMVIATYRNVELPAGHPLPATRQALSRQSNFFELTLYPLPIQAMQMQLSNLLEQPVPTDVADAIHDTTEGNPLFAEEIARELQRRGQVPAAGARWDVTALAQLALPRTIVDVLEYRLKYLSEPAAKTLQLAAVIGPKFAFSLLQSVSGEAEQVLLNHLDEALRLHVVHDLGRGDQLGFTHGLLHTVLLTRISPPQRRVLHRKVAERLETLYGERKQLRDVADQLAEHYQAAGEPEKAIDYWVMAGQSAQQANAPATAGRYFRQAVDLLKDTPMEHQQLVATLGLADAQFAEGHYNDAQTSYETALEWLPPGKDDLIAAQIKRQIALALDRRGQIVAALNWRNRALQRVRAAENAEHSLEALILTDVGWTLFRAARKQEAFDHYQESRALLDGNSDDPAVRAALLYRLGQYYLDRREVKKAEEAALESLNLQRGLNAAGGIARSYDLLASIYQNGDDWHSAVGYALDGLLMAEHSGDVHTMMALLFTCGTLEVQRGEFDEASDHSAHLQHLAQASGEPFQLAAAARLQGHLWLEQQQWAEAIGALDTSLAYLKPLGEPDFGLLVSAYLSEAWLGQGKLSQAEEVARKTLEKSQKDGDMSLLQMLASGLAHMVLGASASESQAWDTAYEHLGQALSLHMTLPNSFEAARCYYYLGLLEGNRGQFDQADTMLSAAEESFNRLGSQHYLRRVRQAQQAFSQTRQLPNSAR